MVETVGTASIADPPAGAPAARDAAFGNAVTFVPANTGEAHWVMGCRFSYLVTGAESGGSYFTLLVDVGPESGPPPHIHHREDEQFYVLDGQLTYAVGDRTFEANAGDFIHIPRGRAHWFKTGQRAARLLATFAPAGIETFFRAIGEPAADDITPPPPVTEAMIGRLLALETQGWNEHHDTLPPGSAVSQ